MKYINLLVFPDVASMQAAPDFKHGKLALVLATMSFYMWSWLSKADDASTAGSVVKTDRELGRWVQVGGPKHVTLDDDAVISGLTKSRDVFTLNKTTGLAVELPKATGSGAEAEFIIGTALASGDYIIKMADHEDSFVGIIREGDQDTKWNPGTDHDTITLNGGTTGGKVGDSIRVIDVAADTWMVIGLTSASATAATPFSETVVAPE